MPFSVSLKGFVTVPVLFPQTAAFFVGRRDVGSRQSTDAFHALGEFHKRVRLNLL